MNQPIPHRTYPCTQCPWRRDSDLSQFSDDDFAMLERNNGRRGHEAALDTPRVACHLDQPGTANPMRRCAGWLAVVGPEHLGVRLEVATRRLPPTVLAPRAGWPDLYDGLDEMLEHRHEHGRGG